jgi:hypothetical protein
MDQATSLAYGRIAVGAVAWIAPKKALRAGLLDTESPQSPYLMRLFGVRDVALGAITLMAPAPSRPALLKLGLAVDGADVAAALLALKAGQLKGGPALAMVGAAGTAVLAGSRALAEAGS